MQMLARGYLVYDLTGSAALLGFVSAGMAIPMLFLAPFGGVIADRVERKRLIQVGQVIVAMFALVIGAAIFTDRIEWYHLLIVSILQGTVWTFMMPARQAIIPQIVGPERIGNAMALNAAGMSAMTLIAPAVAGGLYALAGPANVYFIISGLSLLSVALTTLVPKPDQKRAGQQKARYVQGHRRGPVYIKGNSMVLVLLVMGLATTLLASPFRMLLPVFVVDIYHRGPDSMGLLVAIMGGGSLVGSLAIAALGDWRRGMLLIIGSFISGIALLLIASFPFYYAGAGHHGVGGTWRRRTPHDQHGPHHGGGGRPVPRARDERVHDELRTDAAGSAASRHDRGRSGRSDGHRHTRRPADTGDSGGPAHPEGPSIIPIAKRIAEATFRHSRKSGNPEAHGFDAIARALCIYPLICD